MLRTMAERLARGMAFKRTLPSWAGGLQLYVSPDAQLKYLKPGATAFDLTLLNLARSHIRSDSVVWDVGANVGVFTFAAAGIARDGEVIAIEPDYWLGQLLHRSARLQGNRALRIAILTAALAEHNGVSELSIARRGRASNYLVAAGGWSQAGGERERVRVPTLTLDTLLEHFAVPTFVKIDVEGAEALVLRGAKQMLEKVRPMMYIEVGSGNSPEVSELLMGAGYRLYDGRKPLDGQAPMRACTQDTLAVAC